MSYQANAPIPTPSVTGNAPVSSRFSRRGRCPTSYHLSRTVIDMMLTVSCGSQSARTVPPRQLLYGDATSQARFYVTHVVSFSSCTAGLDRSRSRPMSSRVAIVSKRAAMRRGERSAFESHADLPRTDQTFSPLVMASVWLHRTLTRVAYRNDISNTPP